MADSRTISGTVTTRTNDSGERVAYDLMEKIATHESIAMTEERKKRDYWIKLYHQCFRATRGATPEDILKP
jgi:hypothetical protein